MWLFHRIWREICFKLNFDTFECRQLSFTPPLRSALDVRLHLERGDFVVVLELA